MKEGFWGITKRCTSIVLIKSSGRNLIGSLLRRLQEKGIGSQYLTTPIPNLRPLIKLYWIPASDLNFLLKLAKFSTSFNTSRTKKRNFLLYIFIFVLHALDDVEVSAKSRSNLENRDQRRTNQSWSERSGVKIRFRFKNNLQFPLE